MRKWCYWDGSIVKDDAGKYHMYASRWTQSQPHGNGWKEYSKGIHAVSDHVIGPYEDMGLTWPDWKDGLGHNVIGLRMFDGRYAMVTSDRTRGEVFVADGPNGPFKLLGDIEVDANGFSPGLARYQNGPSKGNMSNVMIVPRPDGRYMIVARSTAVMISEDGILGPYKIVSDRVYLDMPEIPQSRMEDPTAWFSGGIYHMLVNHWPGKTTYHFSSEDGIHDWKYRGIAYRKDEALFRYPDGTVDEWNIVQRPTAYTEDGHITHFNFSVIDVTKGADRGNDNHGSKIIVVPFDGEAFDRDMQTNSSGGRIAAPLKALIVDGQNNHRVWPKSTIMMKQYLEETGLFAVDIARTKFLKNSRAEADWLELAGVPGGEETKAAQTDPEFFPEFSKYDVVISNFGYRAAPWPKKTQEAFEVYMREGGGFVSVHAADNCFPEWEAYNQMIGLGGWGGRSEKSGPYVYVNKLGEVVRDGAPGICGKHGKRSDFLVSTYDRAHPVTKGLPTTWVHAYDECYAYLRGPAENLTVLGTAESTLTKRAEPMLMAINYHEGRTFHTTLGHDTKGFECVGFITTFQRGAEWTATGTVTQTEIPADFPGAEKPSSRTFTPKADQTK